jgi:phosphohistidine phosphatase
MRLYIMRHGIAFERGEWSGSDAERPLTEEGRTRAAQVATALARSGRLKVDEVWSSPLTRAHQTAEVAAAAVGRKVEIVPALAAGATLRRLQRAAATRGVPASLLVVGHEPDCGELVAALTGDEAEDHGFKKAGVALLEGKLAPGGMKLHWHIAPKDALDEDGAGSASGADRRVEPSRRGAKTREPGARRRSGRRAAAAVPARGTRRGASARPGEPAEPQAERSAPERPAPPAGPEPPGVPAEPEAPRSPPATEDSGSEGERTRRVETPNRAIVSLSLAGFPLPEWMARGTAALLSLAGAARSAFVRRLRRFVP